MAQNRRRTFSRAFSKYNAFATTPYRRQSETPSTRKSLLLAGGLLIVLCIVADPMSHQVAVSRNASIGQGQQVASHPLSGHATVDTRVEPFIIAHAHANRSRVATLADPIDQLRKTFPDYLKDESDASCVRVEEDETVRTTLIMAVSAEESMPLRLRKLCQASWTRDPFIAVLKSPQVPSSDLMHDLEDTVLSACPHVDILYVPTSALRDGNAGNDTDGRLISSIDPLDEDVMDQSDHVVNGLPISYLHNQALERSETSHVLILDEHTLPMPDLADSIRTAYATVPTDQALAVPSILTRQSEVSTPDVSACIEAGLCRIANGPEKWSDTLQPIPCFPSTDFAPYLVLPWCSLLEQNDDNTDDRFFSLRRSRHSRRRRTRELTRNLPLSWHDERLSPHVRQFAQADQWRIAGGKFWWLVGFVQIEEPSQEKLRHNLDDGINRSAFHQLVLDYFRQRSVDQVLSTCSR